MFNHWSEAASYNIGTPVSPLPSSPKVFQTGTESADESTYYVYERQFTGSDGQSVLVLYKPVSMLPDNGGASKLTGTSSATTVNLPASYYVLLATGSLSITAQTSITLDNGEGAILVEEETDGPDIAEASTVAASGPTNGVAAALSSTPSASGSAVSQGSPGSLPSDLLAGESFERLLPGLFTPNAAGASQASLALPAEERNASAELDEFLSLRAVENMIASLAEGNGPATNWPTEGSQAPLTPSVPPASLWLSSLRPSKSFSNNSSSDESTSPADNAVASSPVDDPVAPSSAN